MISGIPFPLENMQHLKKSCCWAQDFKKGKEGTFQLKLKIRLVGGGRRADLG